MSLASSMARGGARLLAGAACVAAAALTACGPEVVYRPRPGFATAEDLPDEITLEDGTVIRYVPLSEYLARKAARKQGKSLEDMLASAPKDGENAAPGFLAWEEADDGAVRMQAIMPEHVVANAMRAFREERYGELWDQLVSSSVRRRAELADDPELARAKFVDWCSKRRGDAMTLLNRMAFGFSSNAVMMRKSGPTLLELTLAPQVSGEFKLRVVEIEYEQTAQGERVMLAGIR